MQKNPWLVLDDIRKVLQEPTDNLQGSMENSGQEKDASKRIPDEDREHLVSTLFACPFCGNRLAEQDPPDTIYPVGHTDLWQAVCQGNAGGCDASILAGSPMECTAKWNTRALKS